MKTSRNFKASITALAAMCCASVATAAPTVYFAEDTTTSQSVVGTNSAAQRSVFLSSLIGVGTETFETKTAGSTAPLDLDFPGALTARLNGAGCVDITLSSPCGVSNPGRWATSGTQFWEVNLGGEFNITFDTPISAFGFYGTDIGDFAGRLRVTLTDTNNLTTVLDVDHSVGTGDTANTLLFWGFIDTNVAYTQLRFSNFGSGTDVFGFDDMVIGSREQIQPAPEPGSLALAGLALCGLMAAGRRRRA